MELACPKCTSGEVRKLSMIYNEGLSIINTRTQSSAAGIGFSGGGVGFGSSHGSAHTTGRQQTALSKQASPPAKKHTILWGGASVIMAIWTLTSFFPITFGSFILLGLTALGVRLTLKAWQFNRDEYPDMYAKWEQSFMCNRCGEVFVPAA
jgi:hypothetical protein